MARLVLLPVLIALATACGGEEDAPSCQAALSHYYEAGCSYYDLSTMPPTPIEQNTMVVRCQQSAIDAPERCQGEIDAWLVCLNEVPTGSTTNEQCDCSAEYMALLRC